MFHKPFFYRLPAVLLFLFVPFCLLPDHAQAQLNQPTDIIESRQFQESGPLISTSDVIAYVHIEAASAVWPTGNTLSGQRRLMNSRQPLIIHWLLKGRIVDAPFLLATGVDPLPEPTDPLNLKYTGALAAGDYVLFLKAHSAKPYYILNGGFSGVYPVYNGRLIALKEGVAIFNQKTVPELQTMLQRHD